MTRTGLVVVTVLVGGVLVGLTWWGVHYLKSGEAPTPAPAKADPVHVETPRPGRAVEPATEVEEAEPTPVGEIAVGPAVQEFAAAPATPVAPAVGGGGAEGGGADADAGLAAARAGRIVEAQRRLSEAVRKGVAGARAAEVHKALGEVTDLLLAGPETPAGYPYIKIYEVASGDALAQIGRRFLVPYELVMRMNRLGSDRINAGQKLRVLQGPVHIEILKGRFELRAWCDQVCLKVYRIALGKENSTPEGTFVVEKKIKNPPYQPQHKPKSAFRDAGAPDNPLGSRWIDIGGSYGIHGTIEPQSIGTRASEGCIRLLNKDVEELYDLVVPGASKVTIRP